jgi:hypothetical protein
LVGFWYYFTRVVTHLHTGRGDWLVSKKCTAASESLGACISLLWCWRALLEVGGGSVPILFMYDLVGVIDGVSPIFYYVYDVFTACLYP